MSDELVKRLRDARPATQDFAHTTQGDLMDEAADRIEQLTAERDAALAEVEQWRLSHGHLDQLAVDLSVRLIIAGVWPKPMHEGEDGTEAEYIACCANILEAVGRLTAERERLALAICGGEDAPGYANAQTVETLEHVAKQNRQSHGATINSLLAAEAERDRLREALVELVQQTHNCERELTEDLHHVDFCGESVPLTNARAALKGETP